MALYQKIDGVWTLCQRPYVKRNGVWTAASEAWVKRSGAWVQAYLYDVTPPNPPEITLNIHENWDTVNGSKKLTERWIRVGVKLPGGSNDPTARLSRVLTTYAGKSPTTPLGGTYTSESDSDWPSEPWSDWRYNDFGKHDDSSVLVYKQWPRNASGVAVKPDTTYYFGGWSQDVVGNWSVANQTSIHVPKDSVDAPNVIVKEARFQPNSSGSWTGTGWVSGDLVQQNSPRSVGLWLYGNQITDAVGSHSSSITVTNAQIFIQREDDLGQANANIYLYWTGYGSVGGLPSPGSGIGKTDITKIGTLAKGQGAWFDLPNAFKADLNSNIKSIGLDYKDPVKASAFPEDYSSVVGIGTNLRCGELHVVWEEQL